MEFPTLRLWIMFYLIAFVTLLWAVFLSAQGTMLWVSLMLVIVVVGISSSVVFKEIKKHAERQKIGQDLTQHLRENIREK
jgi:predicted membrane protein